MPLGACSLVVWQCIAFVTSFLLASQTTSVAATAPCMATSYTTTKLSQCHVTSCRIMPCRVVSHHCASCRVVASCRVASCRVPWHVAWCRVVSCCAKACHIVPCRIVPYFLYNLGEFWSIIIDKTAFSIFLVSPFHSEILRDQKYRKCGVVARVWLWCN